MGGRLQHPVRPHKIGFLRLLLVLVLVCWDNVQSRVEDGADAAAPESGPGAAGRCALSPVYDIRTALKDALDNGANLVYMDVDLVDEEGPEKKAQGSGGAAGGVDGGGGGGGGGGVFERMERELRMFQPRSWVRSSSRRGRSLLMLADNYDVLSLFLLHIRVRHLEVRLRSSPPGCEANMTAKAFFEELRTLLLNDFKIPTRMSDAGNSLTTKAEEQICHREVRRAGENTAHFVYVCCHDELSLNRDPRAPEVSDVRREAKCQEVTRGPWLTLLLMTVLLIRVLVVLYSPNLLPGTLYRMKYDTLKYVYHLPAERMITLRMLKTTRPWTYDNDDRVVRLDKLTGMDKLRATVDAWEPDRVHDVTVKNAQLAIKARKLLGENTVPVGIMKVLYNNFFLCRLRHIPVLTGCCNTNILGTLNPGFNLPTWLECARVFARVLLFLLLIMPWVVRLLIYHRYERPLMEAQVRAAEMAGLEVPFSGSFTLYLTPLHLVFVICYVILGLDSLAYGVLSKAVKEKMKVVLLRCLRDMRERSKAAVCGWVVSILVLPCTFLGVLGLLLFPLFLVVFIIVLVPVLAFYMFPAINLSCRLMLHVLLFVCPSRVTHVLHSLTNKASTRFNRHTNLDNLTSGESLEKKSSFSVKGLLFQILVLLIMLVSFWSVTFLVMELLSFLVEMAVYTFIGLVVTANVTIRYISVFGFLILYANRSFSAIYNKYLQYHKTVHGQLVSMMRNEIDAIARTEMIDQENTALRVQGAMATPSGQPPVSLIVSKGRPFWSTSSILLFLDIEDTPFTPEHFFRDTIDLNYCGCPGLLYVNFLRALWNFLKIVIFLLFVFVVVMAFGNAYNVSSTNQLLATVAGGFIPFVFTHFFRKASQAASMDPQSVQFTTHFHTVINRFQQKWPVFDIDPADSTPKDPNRFSASSSAKPPGTPPPRAHHPHHHHHPMDVPPLSSSTPYSTLTSTAHPPSSLHGSEPRTESVTTAGAGDWEDTPLDIIFDVSRYGANALSRAGLDKEEAGSGTMLNRSGGGVVVGGGEAWDGGRGGGSRSGGSRYQPTERSLQEGDERLLDV